MKSRCCSRIFKAGVSITALTLLAQLTAVTAFARAIEPPSGAIYTASDFPRLAKGVDPGFSGEAFASVWAPAGESWRLTTQGGTITLASEARAADPTPRWQSLGKVEGSKHHLLKVVGKHRRRCRPFCGSLPAKIRSRPPHST